MSLERLFQIMLAALLTLGTLVLGIGQMSYLLPALAAAAAVASVWLTDISGKVQLKQRSVTLAAILALSVFFLDLFWRSAAGEPLMVALVTAFANLLVYLQFVLLFQRKDLKIYWQLLMLSLLQVVVAAALALSPWFAPLVVAYLFLGLLTLSLFFAVRESLPYRPALAGDASAGSGADRLPPVRGSLPREGFQPVAREDLASASIGRDLLRHTAWLGLLTFMLASVLFFLMPRFQKKALITTALATHTMIGYNESVQLGNLGVALQDPTSVMRVWFVDPVNNLPYSVHEEPLFRGAVVETYENHLKNEWKPHVRPGVVAEPSDMQSLIPGTPHVLERITLEELREGTVFSVAPAFRNEANCPVEYNAQRQQLIRKTRKGQLEFTLATTGLSGGRHVEILPAATPLRAEDRIRLLKLPDGERSKPLPQLTKFAADTVARLADEERDDPRQKIRALSEALRPSNGFEYFLGELQRDPALDPVEDFVAHNRQGHCEYFATALALMLRSQGIPARVVIGFKGGEFNSLGNFYQVRMLHAHTWVEAFLGPDELPDGVTARHGGWLTLDPTPGSEDFPETRNLTFAEQVREWMNYSDYLWMKYIVGLDSRKQDEAIYGPLAISVEMMKQVFTLHFWTDMVPRWIGSLFRLQTWRELTAGLTIGSGIAIGAALMLVIYLAWKLKRRLAAWRVGRAQRRQGVLKGRGRAARQRVVVPFYEQLEALLAAHGILRPPSQTQHEFAMAASGQLSETPRLASAASLPRRVVDAFYRVRFGGRALDKGETEAVQRSLRELAAALAVPAPAS